MKTINHMSSTPNPTKVGDQLDRKAWAGAPVIIIENPLAIIVERSEPGGEPSEYNYTQAL